MYVCMYVCMYVKDLCTYLGVGWEAGSTIYVPRTERGVQAHHRDTGWTGIMHDICFHVG